MLTITLSNEMIISGDSEDMRAVAALVVRNLVFDNPQYVSAKRMGTYMSRDLRNHSKILGYRISGEGSLTLPRGFSQKLIPFLMRKEIDYVINDQRIERPLKRKFRYREPTELRPYQRKGARLAVGVNEGIIEAPCGSGKTQILAEIVRRIGQRTLILVHTDDLMRQMSERLSRAFGEEIGIIKQSTVDIKRITVASVQTLSRRELDPKFLKKFGVVMLDESHHMPAESFTVVMRQFPAKYRFGTTATTIRSDGLHGLMFATIGYRFFGVTYRELYDGDWLMPASVKIIDSNFSYRMNSMRQYHKLVKALVEDKERNRQIVHNLVKSSNRYNLVLSSRIDHLEILHDLMVSAHPELGERSALLTGRMSSADRKEVLWQMQNGHINFIFATQLADEGLDLPILDTLHLVYPTRAMGKIQQQVGRIQRTYPGKRDALVYDYRDLNTNVLFNQSRIRYSVYKKTGCEVIDSRGGLVEA